MTAKRWNALTNRQRREILYSNGFPLKHFNDPWSWLPELIQLELGRL